MEHILLNKSTYEYQAMKYLCIKFTNRHWLQKSKKRIDIFQPNKKPSGARLLKDRTFEVA